MLRVLCPWKPAALVRSSSDAHLTRRGDADRVGEDDLGAVEAPGELGHAARIDAPFERAAEGDADRDRRRHLGCGEDLVDARDRLVERGVAVVPVELLGRAERRVHPVQAGRGEALVAALVQHEAGVLGAVAPLDPGDHLLGAGHLRHAVVAHEADRLDARHARGGEAVDELRPRRRLQRLGLVLEAVARADVAERESQRTRRSRRRRRARAGSGR